MTTLTESLSLLEKSGLLQLIQQEPELAYLFRHTLVQEITYDSLLKSDQARLHQAVGETLERLYPERLASVELAPVLAEHFAIAGDTARATHYYTLAGDASARIYANPEAIHHYTQAIELGKDQALDSKTLEHLYLARGRALELSNLYPEALKSYQELVELARQRGDKQIELSALMVITTLHAIPNMLRDPEKVQALSDQALLLAHQLDDHAAEAKILWNLMLICSTTDRAELGIEYGERSLAIARQYNLRQQIAFTLNDIPFCYLATGQIPKALEGLQEAQALWREFGNIPMLADNLSRVALFSLLTGQYEQGIQASAESYQLSKSINNLWGQSFALTQIGQVYYLRGQYRRAVETNEECLDLSQKAGSIVPLITTRTELAWMYAMQGALDHAYELIQQAIQIAQQHLPLWENLVRTWLARLEIRRGNLEAAQPLLEKSIAALNFEKPLSQMQMAYLVPITQIEFALAKRDFPRVIAAADEALAFFDSAGIKPFQIEIKLAKAQAWLATNQIDEAEAILRALQPEVESGGLDSILWVLLGLRAEIAARRGQAARAQALRQRARQVVLHIADQTLLEIRDSFLEQAEVQAILAQEPG